jgi:hypothetical protein
MRRPGTDAKVSAHLEKAIEKIVRAVVRPQKCGHANNAFRAKNRQHRAERETSQNLEGF